MRFSNDVVAELKTRLLRTKANGFKFTDAEAKDAASVLGLSVEQVQLWNRDVHAYYKPYGHEKESHMEMVEAFLSSKKVCLLLSNFINIEINTFWLKEKSRPSETLREKCLGVFATPK